MFIFYLFFNYIIKGRLFTYSSLFYTFLQNDTKSLHIYSDQLYCYPYLLMNSHRIVSGDSFCGSNYTDYRFF